MMPDNEGDFAVAECQSRMGFFFRRFKSRARINFNGRSEECDTIFSIFYKVNKKLLIYLQFINVLSDVDKQNF